MCSRQVSSRFLKIILFFPRRVPSYLPATWGLYLKYVPFLYLRRRQGARGISYFRILFFVEKFRFAQASSKRFPIPQLMLPRLTGLFFFLKWVPCFPPSQDCRGIP